MNTRMRHAIVCFLAILSNKKVELFIKAFISSLGSGNIYDEDIVNIVSTVD